MKDSKNKQDLKKTNAEKWVEVAKEFGEKCVDIQRDSKLTLDQKLAKQKSLSQEMTKQIQNDTHLEENDKKVMIESIDSYLKDWTKLHDTIQNNQEQPTKKKEK